MNLPIQQHATLSSVPREWLLQLDFTRSADAATLLTLQQGQKTIVAVGYSGRWLSAEFHFEEHETPITLNAELPEAGDASVLFANSPSRIAVYVNGQLWDEDWTLGAVPLENSVCTECAGQATLHDDFSVEQGFQQASNRAPITNIQNWKPNGFNTGAGDCMPFAHDGVYHLFYLFDRRGHGSKWGLGAHQWAHLSTTDLMTWQEHPLAIAIDEQVEGSICTGSLIFHEGTYYAFYAVRMSDRSAARFSWAASSDGVHFQKSERFFTLSAPYEPVSGRDPFVFRDADGLFHLLVTTSLIDAENGTRRGCLAHLTSTDLQAWQQEPEPFLVLEIEDQPECADYFLFNGWYYLIFSNYGSAQYRMSRSPFGPWQKPENDVLGYKECRVPRTAIFDGNRIIVAGFVVHPQARYAGEVIVYEALQNDDGTLSFVTPEELAAPKTVLR